VKMRAGLFFFSPLSRVPVPHTRIAFIRLFKTKLPPPPPAMNAWDSDAYDSPLSGGTPGSDEGRTDSVLAFWAAGAPERDLQVRASLGRARGERRGGAGGNEVPRPTLGRLPQPTARPWPESLEHSLI
jgi:hypothetical protein